LKSKQSTGAAAAKSAVFMVSDPVEEELVDEDQLLSEEDRKVNQQKSKRNKPFVVLI
jgi:hypothetical protein